MAARGRFLFGAVLGFLKQMRAYRAVVHGFCLGWKCLRKANLEDVGVKAIVLTPGLSARACTCAPLPSCLSLRSQLAQSAQ